MKKIATYEIEEQLRTEGYEYIIGVDEVGRGPGAGPVVAAAVYVPPDRYSTLLGRVKDSKQLTERNRIALDDEIRECCVWAVGRVDNDMIDEIGIGRANRMAMEMAVNQLADVDYMLIDGNRLLSLDIPQRYVIKGDMKSISIAAASIVAKVERDEEMKMLHWIYPEYDWINNKGYLTKKHIKAIETYGITEYHRTSFRRVSDYIEYNPLTNRK
jgi:ribonuclease HII